MATKKDKKGSPKKRKLAGLNKDVLKQFEGLNPNDPGQWPLVPQLFAYVLAAALVIFIAYFAILSTKYEKLDNAKRDERALKEEFTKKTRIAANLVALEQQRLEVEQYVYQLEARLPSEALMDKLLSDISKAGITNGLLFERLQSEDVIVQEYYAEQPISITATGNSYDNFAKFAETLAKLDRIVTLDNVTLEPFDPKIGEPSGMKLTGTLKTYRYMSEKEQADNRALTEQSQSRNRR